MRIESNLCHISENKAVVCSYGWINEEKIGSALGEAENVEKAEDNAIARLMQRLNKPNIIDNKSKPIKKEDLANNLNYKSNNKNIDLISVQNRSDPTDWSKELAEIDIEIKKLNWNRDDESLFITKEFGYNNRQNITNYKELVSYLEKLRKLNHESMKTLTNNPEERLIYESDKILNELSWDYTKGREYLQKEFNVSTRKDLTHDQLILFVNKLKSINNSTNNVIH